MISPELLRRYPFFANLNDSQQKAIAMIAEERIYDTGATFFEEGKPADAIYLLLTGGVDLYFKVGSEYGSKSDKEFPVDEINVGEPFGISALIDPFIFTSTARASQKSRVIWIGGTALRALCERDPRMAYILVQHIARAFAERLRFSRIQLAAARA